MSITKFGFLLLFSVSYQVMFAQDLLITKDNKSLEVEIISSDSKLTFYRFKNDPEIKIINTKELLSIRFGAVIPEQETKTYSSKSQSKYIKDNARSGSTLSKATCALAVLSTLFLTFELDLDNSSSRNGRSLGRVFFISAVTFATISFLTSNAGRKLVKRNKDLGFESFPTEDVRRLQKEGAREMNIGFADTGIGIKMSF